MLTKRKLAPIAVLLSVLLVLSACAKRETNTDLVGLSYGKAPYAEINNNIPQFSEDMITTEAFEHYSPLDMLGRCGVATACIGKEIMPTEERGNIGQVKPSGWQISKYDFIDGKYLYNRCHLIGYQLTGENANERNLITGTRYMNVEGMLPFENMVDDYIEETNHHVMYRVTPVFEGNNLVAKGVQMEAYSVEDRGKGIAFNVFVFNVQPGVTIRYEDGTNELSHTDEIKTDAEKEEVYILNTNTKKFHLPDCPSVEEIQAGNGETYRGTRESLPEKGFSPCARCKP